MLPTCMLADRPLRPLIASDGMPHSGASRGNSTNSTAMMGAPSRAIQLAVFSAVIKGGRPTSMCALTSAVSRPSRPTSIAAAVSSDCEKKKLVSIVKKPRKKITKASRRARSSSVLSASSTTISVTPASRPSKVRCVNSVAPSVTASRPSSHHLPGQRPAPERQPAAPEQHPGRQQAAPDRQVADLRHHHPGDHGQQEQGVARVAGQGVEAVQHRCQRLQAGQPVRRAAGRLDLQAGQAQTVVHAQPVGGQHPGAQAAQPGFGFGQAGLDEVEPEFVALGLLGVAADQLVGLGEFLPDHQLHRVAAPVGANAIEFSGGLRAGGVGAAGAGLAGRQWRRESFWRRVDQHFGRWSPDGPDPEGAQRKTCLRGERRNPVPSALVWPESDLHQRFTLRGDVGPGPVAGSQHAQADGVPRAPALIDQFHVEKGGLPSRNGQSGAIK